MSELERRSLFNAEQKLKLFLAIAVANGFLVSVCIFLGSLEANLPQYDTQYRLDPSTGADIRYLVLRDNSGTGVEVERQLPDFPIIIKDQYYFFFGNEAGEPDLEASSWDYLWRVDVLTQEKTLFVPGISALLEPGEVFEQSNHLLILPDGTGVILFTQHHDIVRIRVIDQNGVVGQTSYQAILEYPYRFVQANGIVQFLVREHDEFQTVLLDVHSLELTSVQLPMGLSYNRVTALRDSSMYCSTQEGSIVYISDVTKQPEYVSAGDYSIVSNDERYLLILDSSSDLRAKVYVLDREADRLYHFPELVSASFDPDGAVIADRQNGMISEGATYYNMPEFFEDNPHILVNRS